MKRSPFELIPIGPPCLDPQCKGILQDHIRWTEPRECYRKCSECGKEYDRMPLADKMGWAVRTIKRAMGGVKSD